MENGEEIAADGNRVSCGNMHADVLGKFAEISVLGNCVGIAGQFDHHAQFAAGMDAHIQASIGTIFCAILPQYLPVRMSLADLRQPA